MIEREIMAQGYTEIRVGGKSLLVPSACVMGRTVIVTGGFVTTAAVHDEELLEGAGVNDPGLFIRALSGSGLEADIFTFGQHLPDVTPKYEYPMEWDNVAAIPTTDFAEWWEHKVSGGLRKDVRRAKNRGVVVREVQFNDEFVRGIMGIYNETAVRQGMRFWHYGKSFDQVKGESATYLDRSVFLGAYYNDELIGFLKFVHVGQLARMMFILSKVAHRDKRPTNALVAKAVEVSEARKCSYLTYGNFTYNRNIASSLTAFKRRNGFEQILFPRYYVPLTLRGRIGFKLNLHHGMVGLVPLGVLNLMRNARAFFFEGLGRAQRAQAGGAVRSHG